MTRLRRRLARLRWRLVSYRRARQIAALRRQFEAISAAIDRHRERLRAFDRRRTS